MIKINNHTVTHLLRKASQTKVACSFKSMKAVVSKRRIRKQLPTKMGERLDYLEFLGEE